MSNRIKGKKTRKLNQFSLSFVSDFFIGEPDQTEVRGNSLTLSTYKRRTDLGTLVVPSMHPTNPLHTYIASTGYMPAPTPGIDFINCFAPIVKILRHKKAFQKLGVECK